VLLASIVHNRVSFFPEIPLGFSTTIILMAMIPPFIRGWIVGERETPAPLRYSETKSLADLPLVILSGFAIATLVDPFASTLFAAFAKTKFSSVLGAVTFACILVSSLSFALFIRLLGTWIGFRMRRRTKQRPDN
jgi:hypothetical protein